MGFLAAIPALIGTAAAGVGSAVGGAASALGGGLAALGGGSAAAGASAAGSLISGGLGIAGALNPPKPPAPMMAPPVQALPNPPKNNNTSFAALATPSSMTNFGSPKTGQTKTLLGQ